MIKLGCQHAQMIAGFDINQTILGAPCTQPPRLNWFNMTSLILSSIRLCWFLPLNVIFNFLTNTLMQKVKVHNENNDKMHLYETGVFQIWNEMSNYYFFIYENVIDVDMSIELHIINLSCVYHLLEEECFI